MPHFSVLALALALAGCAPKTSGDQPQPDALEVQRDLANTPGKDQTLEEVRLASLAMARGDLDLADAVLTRAVLDMQDFRADGQFRATVGVESAKEWKGEPYEKMMAFLYLGILRYQRGEYGNALAMSKSALLADTGTRASPYQGDFIPAYVLQAMAYAALGEQRNAEASIQRAVDARLSRTYIQVLTRLLNETEVPAGVDPEADATARVLLLSGLPVGLSQHPRDPEAAIDAAHAWAIEARGWALNHGKKDWADDLTALKKGELRRADAALSVLGPSWRDAWSARDLSPEERRSIEQDELFLLRLVRDPGPVLWIESGRGPIKWAEGRYAQILTYETDRQVQAPAVRLDGTEVFPHWLDSTGYQATTRGGRGVDGFLKGKAIFKDTTGILGIALLEAGEIAAITSNSESGDAVAMILGLAGLGVYVTGALTNPRADTRTWDTLPDSLYLVRLDAEPGEHKLTIDGQPFSVNVPDDGRMTHLIPARSPRGARVFGIPCTQCSPSPLEAP